MPMRPRALLAVCVLLPAAILAIAGCGGSSPAATSSKSPTPLTLSAPTTVASGKLAEVSTAVDRHSGRLYVTWSTALGKQIPAGWGPAGNVYVAWSDDGGKTFSPPVRVGSAAGEDFSGSPVNIGVTPKGTVVMDWENNTADPSIPAGGQFAIRVARSTDRGRTWTVSTQPPDGGKQLVSRPNLYVSPSGQVWLDWLDGRPVDRKIPEPLYDVDLSLSRDEGRTFSYSWVAKSQSCQCCRPALAQGPHGLLALAWRNVVQAPGSEGHAEMDMSDMSDMSAAEMKAMPATADIRDIKVATSADGGREWGVGVEPHDDHWKIDGCPIIGPSLFYTPDGKELVVSWFTGATGRIGVWTASSEDNGKTWSAPTRLTSSVVATGADIVGMAGSDGGHWTAWATPRAVQAARIEPGGDLAETKPLPGVAAGVAPALAETSRGTLLFYIAKTGAGDRLLARLVGG
ncbi:MAG TPA: sialidase family protein [Solirubrobacterales bacterium]|nr:sialidase family protein [Solirubrobacterales bacterium]